MPSGCWHASPTACRGCPSTVTCAVRLDWGAVVLGRRIGIGPEPDEQRARNDQGRHVDDEDRLVGVEAVERETAQGRTEAGSNAEHGKHDAIDLAVRLEPEVATEKESHQVDLGADAGAAQDGADKGDKPAAPAEQQRDPDDGNRKEEHRDVRPPEAVETPAGQDAADDDGIACEREDKGRVLGRDAAIGE